MYVLAYTDTSVRIFVSRIIRAVGCNLLTHSEPNRRRCLLMSAVQRLHGALFTGGKKKRGRL